METILGFKEICLPFAQAFGKGLSQAAKQAVKLMEDNQRLKQVSGLEFLYFSFFPNF
jgi:hypothetical protein